MDPEPSKPDRNRRTARRRAPKRSVQFVCYANAMGLGPNLALSLLDVSETGARATVTVPLTPPVEIEVNLGGINSRRPFKVIAEVVWCVPEADGTFQVGLKFQRYLTYEDLQDLGS